MAIDFDINKINAHAYTTLETYVDNFSKVADIPSDLLFGEPQLSKDPWISVIIPTYNRTTLFQEAVMSVLLQISVDFSWELIVVDNTPFDAEGKTPALRILQKINDRRVLYYHNRENIGSGYNWNRGVELARGEWVCFLHDDDLLSKCALWNIGRMIQTVDWTKKKLGFLYARRTQFSTEYKEPVKQRKRGFTELTQMRALVIGDTGTGMPSCGTTIRKQAYMEVGGINYDFGPTADAVLGYQIMAKYAVICSDVSLGGYRWAENETLKKRTLQKLVEADWLFACYRYSRSRYAAFWGRCFGRVIRNQNIHYKLEVAEKAGLSMNVHDFDDSLPYKRSNFILRGIYIIIKAAYIAIRAKRAKRSR